MNEEAVREKLLAAVREAFNKPGVGGSRDVAESLIPVVREIAAEELREAANDLIDYSGHCAQADARAITAYYGSTFRNRADDLTKPPDGPVR